MTEARKKGNMNMPNNEDGYISTPIACKRYGIANITLKRWMKDPAIGFPAPLMHGNRYYFKLSEVKEWERGRRRVSGSPDSIAKKAKKDEEQPSAQKPRVRVPAVMRHI